jgi:hypothetical protein
MLEEEGDGRPNNVGCWVSVESSSKGLVGPWREIVLASVDVSKGLVVLFWVGRVLENGRGGKETDESESNGLLLLPELRGCGCKELPSVELFSKGLEDFAFDLPLLFLLVFALPCLQVLRRC